MPDSERTHAEEYIKIRQSHPEKMEKFLGDGSAVGATTPRRRCVAVRNAR